MTNLIAPAEGIQNNRFFRYNMGKFVTLADAQTFTGVKQILGTSTNDSAASGYVGEVLSATKLRSAGVALSNNITADVTSKALTAGDWDVYTQIGFTASVGTTVLSLGLSLTSATLPGTDVLFVPTSGEVWAQIPINAVTSDGGDSLYSRVSVASTTTVYAVARAAFAAGSCSAYGSIFARRAR